MCIFFREVQYLQKLIEYNEKRQDIQDKNILFSMRFRMEYYQYLYLDMFLHISFVILTHSDIAVIFNLAWGQFSYNLFMS